MTNKNSNNMIEELFATGAHFGYSKTKRHPSVVEYIFGQKDGVDIIDLEQTEQQIIEAKIKLAEISAKGKYVIVVGTKYEARETAEAVAKVSPNVFYVNNRWIGGTLTNFDEIKKRLFKLEKLRKEKEDGDFAKYTKKEQLKLDKEIEKLEKYYNGIVGMKKLPEAIIVVDSKHESIAVKEAIETGVKIISISNTDCDISNIDYPIMANDTSSDTIKYILNLLSENLKSTGEVSKNTNTKK